jgi:hypothetical protein
VEYSIHFIRNGLEKWKSGYGKHCIPNSYKSISDESIMILGQKLYRQFSRVINPKKRKSIRSLFRLFQVAVYAVVVVFAINLLSLLGTSSFGEWGDFFGGVLNPILTFIMFMGLLITIVLQQTELRESRAELKRSADSIMEQTKNAKVQNFESTFFKMLSIHNDLVSSIDLAVTGGRVTQGRDCFNIFYTRLNKLYREHEKKGAGKYSKEETLRLAYKQFWTKHQTELGHYYRYLYNIVRFIKEQGYSDGPYLRLVRAQLSDQESLLLLYNCISDNGGNFTPLVEEFSLLDNLPLIRVLDQEHLSLIDSLAYGIKESTPQIAADVV